ncbi:MAG: cupin domain-containing protein [Opitutaceae bacterium]|nr:cupin domain-containing protein [Opitutaceae bacterium]
MNPPTPSPRSTVVVPPLSARVIRAFGDEVTVLLSGQETGGKYSMFSMVTPPGGGPPPHRHQNEDEWFWVLEGRAEFFKDGAWAAVPVGTAVFTPRGVVHTFRNGGDTPLRMLMHTAPSGFETFFARCADEFAKSSPPDMGRIVAIAAEHGIHFA